MKILIKILFSILSLAIASIPTLIVIVLWSILNPVGFWQGLALIGIWAYLLGGIQIILLILFLSVLVVIWTEQ